MTPLVSLGAGITGILGDVAEKVESAITAVINVLKTILSYIYMFMLRFWSFVAENPKGALTLFANIWVMMV